MTTYSKLTREERDEFHARAQSARGLWGIDPNDYRRLAVIEHQLSRWYLQECNGDIERCEETGKVYRYYGRDRPDTPVRRIPWKDMESGAVKRAEAIATKYKGHIYLQKDPRGCAVHFYRVGDPGPRTIGRLEKVSQHYSTRALPCFF